MSKRVHIFFVCSCFVGFTVSFFQLLMGEARTFTAEQALVEFLNNGDISRSPSYWAQRSGFGDCGDQDVTHTSKTTAVAFQPPNLIKNSRSFPDLHSASFMFFAARAKNFARV